MVSVFKRKFNKKNFKFLKIFILLIYGNAKNKVLTHLKYNLYHKARFITSVLETISNESNCFIQI